MCARVVCEWICTRSLSIPFEVYLQLQSKAYNFALVWFFARRKRRRAGPGMVTDVEYGEFTVANCAHHRHCHCILENNS